MQGWDMVAALALVAVVAEHSPGWAATTLVRLWSNDVGAPPPLAAHVTAAATGLAVRPAPALAARWGAWATVVAASVRTGHADGASSDVAPWSVCASVRTAPSLLRPDVALSGAAGCCAAGCIVCLCRPR
jgi:hypothetical protein